MVLGRRGKGESSGRAREDHGYSRLSIPMPSMWTASNPAAPRRDVPPQDTGARPPTRRDVADVREALAEVMDLLGNVYAAHCPVSSALYDQIDTAVHDAEELLGRLTPPMR